MATKQNALIYLEARNSPAPAGEARTNLIQECAYFNAMKRDFAPGYELEDWLAAEKEVDEAIRITHEAKLDSGARRPRGQ